jgi:hypothetical protein
MFPRKTPAVGWSEAQLEAKILADSSTVNSYPRANKLSVTGSNVADTSPQRRRLSSTDFMQSATGRFALSLASGRTLNEVLFVMRQQYTPLSGVWGATLRRLAFLAIAAALLACCRSVGLRLPTSDGTILDLQGQLVFEYGDWSGMLVDHHWNLAGVQYASAGGGGRSFRILLVPPWIPASVAALVVWHALRKRRSARQAQQPIALGMCSACGYDLRGSPEQCPECGRPAHGSLAAP